MQKRSFIWFLTVICAVTLAVVTHWQGQDIVPEQDLSECTGASVMAPQQHQHQEATLTDDTLPYRVSSSRPQRILPTHGSRSERTLTSILHFVRHHIVKPLHSYSDSRCRKEAAPCSLSSSCDYYVIALRHIIR